MNKKQELGVVLAVFHRVWPLAGLTLALVATIGWIGLLGFAAIKYSEERLAISSAAFGI